ncbi:hypothetical protein T07_10861 [Trichinella nelsoni]|uniref:Uncharacterized protein n=1 Tax=Trichinella nelsoni TaxID=6336 RepID=A0A0V0RVF5_9BILA|nr:hypothetical protein T07_10861 [Trichinella nelsoni]
MINKNDLLKNFISVHHFSTLPTCCQKQQHLIRNSHGGNSVSQPFDVKFCFIKNIWYGVFAFDHRFKFNSE